MVDIFKRKILAKLIIILVIVVSLISAASIFYFNKSNYDELRKNLDDTLSNIREISKLSYSLPLWQMSKTEIAYLNRAILTNKNIVAVNIYDESFSFMEGMKKDLHTMEIVDEKTTSPFSVPEGTTGIKKLYYTIFHREYIVGSFEIFYTERYVNEEIDRRRTNLLIAFALIGLSTITVIFVVVRKMLISPVLTLADISREITKNKDYSVGIEKTSNDEIGVLYESIANMLQEIKRNEDELQKTKGYLSNIIESMPSILVSIDKNGKVTQWNHAAEDATGIAADEVLERTVWERTNFFDSFKDSVSEIIRTRKPIHLYSHRLERDITSYKDVSLYPLIDNGVSGVVIRMDDVTELEKKENLLRQAQKMETIGTLASGIAHDFNNILGGIIGNTSLIEYKIKSGNDIPMEELLKMIKTIDRASNRAADMVKQLLTLSSKKDVSFSPVDLNIVIKNVLHICQNTFDKMVSLKAKYREGPAMISGDNVQVEQVLLNLCINSYHAMTLMKADKEDRGGVIEIELGKIVPDRHFISRHPDAEPRPYWVLSVKDTGVGMPENVIPKIFDPFFTTKGTGQGTGLGLAVVYNIVRQHFGFIDVSSVLNAGTTFNCYLPCLESVDTEKIVGKDDDLARGEGTILIVDDEAIMRDVARSVLEECGYKTILAEDGGEALRIFGERKDEIDMVLLDVIMPKMSGRQVYKEMKKIDDGVKVLFASGFWQDGEDEPAPGPDDAHFIQKPYTIQALAEAVRKRLS